MQFQCTPMQNNQAYSDQHMQEPYIKIEPEIYNFIQKYAQNFLYRKTICRNMYKTCMHKCAFLKYA